MPDVVPDTNPTDSRFCDRLVIAIFTLALSVLILSLVDALTSVPFN